MFDRCVVPIRHLRRLQKHFAASSIVVHIVRNQNSLKAMLRTAFEHEDVIILKYDFRIDAAIASRTERDGGVIEQIWSCTCRHRYPRLILRLIAEKTNDRQNPNNQQSQYADTFDHHRRADQKWQHLL